MGHSLLRNSSKSNFDYIIKNLHQLTYDTVEQHLALSKSTEASKFINKGKISMIFRDQDEIFKSKSDLEIRKNINLILKIKQPRVHKKYSYLSNHYKSGIEFYDHGWISSPQKYLRR